MEHSGLEPQQFAVAAVRGTLGASSDVDSCVTLTSRIDALMGQAFEYFRKEGASVACRAGCSFCCHLRVMVYPHEAIALFRYLGARLAREQADLVRQRLLGNATHRGCAFLIDGQCSAYEARPSACSGYHSLSKEHCEKAYDGGESSEGTPVLQALRHVAAALADGISQALQACDLNAEPLELQSAVAALLRNPALIERWRSGRKLLQDPR